MTAERVNHLLLDLQKHCQLIISYTEGLSFEQFLAQQMVRDAVERNLTILGIIGVRIREIDDATYEEFPDLRSAIGLRNRLSHGYNDDLNDEVIFEVVTEFIPPFLDQINSRIQS